jgi:hypothetical protein
MLFYIYVRTSVGLMLHSHTLPVPTPIPTVVPYTVEHDGRYSDGTHSMFFPLCWIHVLFVLRLGPTHRARSGSAIAVSLEILELSIAKVPISVKIQELVESKNKLLRVWSTLTVCMHVPLLASHTLTVLSSDADASLVESCEKATE